ncbi:MAG TPA: RNA 2',3'-cyclic phosphodiesterase [Myxococcales bacterium]|nr:RNA 2',3'-cyclic phosphodiesterase [Myxococcales bacterium]
MGPEVERSVAVLPSAGEYLAGTLRCFVALELSREARALLAALIERLTTHDESGPARARWSPPENLHITLKFLGRVEAAQLPAIHARLAEVAAGSGTLRLALKGAGAFPNVRNPSVLWVGVTDPDGKLARLAEAVDQRLGPLGFPAENRTFSPHLTLARVGAPRRARALAEALLEAAHGLDVPLLEDGMVFFRSETLPAGAKHVALFRVPFGRSGGDGSG